jgi:hypothetical protein
MIWLKIAWGLISGNLGTIASAIAGVMNTFSDNKTKQTTTAIDAGRDIEVARVQASAAAWHDRAALLGGMRMTQWLIAAALLPPIAHEGLVFIDSMCWGLSADGVAHGCGLGIPRLPPVYEEREWMLIASLLGIQTGVVGLGSLLRWLHK